MPNIFSAQDIEQTMYRSCTDAFYIQIETVFGEPVQRLLMAHCSSSSSEIVFAKAAVREGQLRPIYCHSDISAISSKSRMNASDSRGRIPAFVFKSRYRQLLVR